ncbi:glycosyltransferase family 4 protein [Methylocaldum sp. RMAD-M]|jgi:glycosyltransferase involved in cell wall biosynthesis|uniref:glycosyltransferase family 4 protein n=1 Tax=Methylocaldum sp. RMAD-M TaxID=2806557 RepID=UPI000A3226C2|nr:glycosyltransferase family 4 protein [Methylocaldum sp. RMAD-M]MBP1152817.1 glycosyltransferase involved in cell wall biosynthesis [Methylocaldum sp. RMAD-M]
MTAKVAFCAVPHYGGIYSVYRRLRDAVVEYGWDVRSVQVAGEEQNWYGSESAPPSREHTTIPVDGLDVKRAVRAFTSWVEREGIDIVMPMSSKIAMAALPHLPPETAVVTRCIEITPIGYRYATVHLPRIDRVVVTSPRQRRDLIRMYRVPEELIRHVPNAVDAQRFTSRTDAHYQASVLRLVVLDRIDERQKRVFMLPGILRRLGEVNIPYQLTVIGNGPDFEALRCKLLPWIDDGRVRLLGAVPSDEVPEFLMQADILVKTSPAEGFPSSLIEAMAAEVVPVVSRVAGVTDWIVQQGKTGILCPINDESAFAAACLKLFREPDSRRRMATAARQDVQRRFGIDQFGRKWADVFSETLAARPAARVVRPWHEFREPNLKGNVCRRLLLRPIPRYWKDQARAVLERWRARIETKYG